VSAWNPVITRHALFDELTGGRDGFLEHFGNEVGPDAIARIRIAVNKGRALGSEAFLDRIENLVGRTVRPPKRGRPFKRNEETTRQGSEMLI
jgi:hypothetical protein